MRTPIYHFGDFRLNPLARELRRDNELIQLSASAFDCLAYLVEHRERPVGRDELISAVWGRVDVSDNLLAQTIARLRYALGYTGSEQHHIKTVTRVGYRWLPETTVTFQRPAVMESDGGIEPPPPFQATSGKAGDIAPSAARPRVKFAWRGYVFGALALALLLVAGSAVWLRIHQKAMQPDFRFDKSIAAVLPADVEAPEDWKWLRFGLMDLISNRLREAQIPTETSQVVLELLKGNADASGVLSDQADFALQVHPHVTLTGNVWRVHLDAKSRDGRLVSAESSASDVLAATRMASDLLLAQIGYSIRTGGPVASGNSQLEYMQRIKAARLAGQPLLARELIDRAPSELLRSPELTYISASIDCDEGKTDSCVQRLLAILKALPNESEPVLRGKILAALGHAYMEKNQVADSEAALTQAVRTLQGQKDVQASADAYRSLGYIEEVLWKFDDAEADFGRAHVNYVLSGDAVGANRTDYSMGLLATRRAQPDIALPLLQHAYDQFQKMGMRSMLPSVLEGLAFAQNLLLKFSDELSTTDRFWPLETADVGFLNIRQRHQLTMVRVMALADNGRTFEAEALAEKLIGESDPVGDAAILAETNRLFAGLALAHGDNEHAAEFASKALTPLLELADQRNYAETWLIRISALQRAAHADKAAREAAAMVEWEAKLPFKDEWTHIYAMRAKARQYWIEGNRNAAIEQLRSAMASAEKLGVPQVVVSVGVPYALALVDTGHIDQAMSVSGTLSTWSDTDWRAAWVEARVYQALGQPSSSEKLHEKAQQLAGDRPLPVASFDFAL